MTTKNNQKKYGFTSLNIHRVNNEEITKNNNIHLSNVTGQKQNENNQYHQTNFKYPQNDNKKKYNERSRNKSGIKLSNYTTIGGLETKNQTKKNVLKICTISKEKNRKSDISLNSKVVKKKYKNHVERIIIDLVRNDDDDNATIKTDSNYFEKENLYKSFINKKENNEDINNLENKDNNSNYKMNDLYEILNIIGNRWKNNCVLSKEQDMSLLYNEIWAQKKEVEKIISRWNNKKKIVKNNNFSFIKNEKVIKDYKKNNINNKYNYNIQKEKKDSFTIDKNINKEYFLYSKKNYIKDLVKNIYIPQNNDNRFAMLNNDNYINDFRKIDYKKIKPNNKNNLETDLNNYYDEKKINYLKNKDNNEELKINPIYIINEKQIKQLYEDLNIQDKNNNNIKSNLNRNSLLKKQMVIDYEIIEVFTPKDNNKDNNTNQNSVRYSSYSNELKNDKISDINYDEKKKIFKYEDFGQVTPLSMLDEKFIIYAVSRISKYSIPQKQGFFSYLNNINNYSNNIKNYSNVLNKYTFSFTIERRKYLNSFKNQKTMSKTDENNIIDFSKLSDNS